MPHLQTERRVPISLAEDADAAETRWDVVSMVSRSPAAASRFWRGHLNRGPHDLTLTRNDLVGVEARERHFKTRVCKPRNRVSRVLNRAEERGS
jgi:hypothetical protein